MNLWELSSLWRLLIFLLPFILVQRWFHRELQYVLLLLTRRENVVMILFSFLFFPGVALHEGSHFLAARLLGVRTGRISLVPQLQSDGKIRMGFVETERVDFVRNSLIGLAPLLSGGLLVAILGVKVLALDSLGGFLSTGDWRALGEVLSTQLSRPLFWLGLYLAVSISSMMLPSESDRRDWVPLIILLVALVLIAYFAGAWQLVQPLAVSWLDRAFNAAGLVFGFSLTVLIACCVPLWILRQVLFRIFHVRIKR